MELFAALGNIKVDGDWQERLAVRQPPGKF
jgi:hypothetical protein